MNERDLDDDIRALVASAVAAAPAAPELPSVDEVRATPSRSNRPDRTGWIMAGAGIAAAAALVGVLVWATDEDDKSIVAASTTLTPTTEPVTVPTTTETAPPTAAPTSTTVENTIPPENLPTAVPQVVVTAGIDGVWRVTDGVAEQLVTDRLSMALQLPDGSLIMQRSSGWSSEYPPSDTTLLGWTAASGIYELFPEEPDDRWIRLYDVALVDGELTVLYAAEVQALPQQASDSQLIARSLETGAATVVAEQFGGWEAGYTRMHLAETGLIVGEFSQEVTRSLSSFAVAGATPIDAATLGVEDSYSDCEDCPRLFTVSRDGNTVAWLDGTRLVRHDLTGAVEYETIELGDAATNVSDLDLGNGFAVLTYYDYPTPRSPHVANLATVDSFETPGLVATAVVDPTPPWQVDDELTSVLAGQEFATGEELYAAEQQIANLKYEPNEDAFSFGRRTLAYGWQAIVAPNFDDSAPETWYRVVTEWVDDRTVVVVRVESVVVCRNFTFSTPTHLCV